MSRINRMRRVVHWSAGALFCLNCVPHLSPSIARKNLELSGSSVPEELIRHVHRIARAMMLPNPEKIQVFISSGFSSMCLGNTLLPGGAVIGLSRMHLFRTEDDVRNSGLAIEGEPVEWDSEFGKKLMHLLLPTVQQTNFSIAHEVAHLQHLDILYHVLLSPITLVLSYHFARTVPKYIFPRHATAVFPFAMALCLLAYAQVSATMSQWQEFRADRTAAVCRKSYCVGGIDTMKKRMYIETMLGPPPSRFNQPVSLRSHPPFPDRLERLENLLKLTDDSSSR